MFAFHLTALVFNGNGKYHQGLVPTMQRVEASLQLELGGPFVLIIYIEKLSVAPNCK